MELMIAMRYFITMVGCKLEPSSLMVGDNMAVVLNTTVPPFTIKKKHQSCNYHKVRESIAAGFINFAHISSEDNMADFFTKPLSRIIFDRLATKYLFRKSKAALGEAIDEGQMELDKEQAKLGE